MIDNSLLERAAGYLAEARRLVAFTGAGVSAESGVPTFRGAGGLWEGHRPEDVATPAAFFRDPAMVWRFYNARRRGLAAVKPNPAHSALVDLENRFKSFALVTQNVDGLHCLAGSRHVLELHGNLWRVRCTGCGRVSDRTREELPDLPKCPQCDALLRPDVVWFTEALPTDVWDDAVAAVERCDCLLVVGTSALVYPAAGLVELARSSGAGVIEVNLDATPATELADVSLLGKAGEVLPALVARLSAKRSGF